MTTLSSVIQKGAFSAIPAASIPGRLYFATDNGNTYRDNGTTWDEVVTSGLINPMTAEGDIIIAGTAGAPTRLAAGADADVLTLVSGEPAWAAPASGGMSNPMTTEGDIIYGGTSGTPARLAAGTSGFLLQSNGSSAAPSWVVAPSGGGGGATVQATGNAAISTNSANMQWNLRGYSETDFINYGGTSSEDALRPAFSWFNDDTGESNPLPSWPLMELGGPPMLTMKRTL